MLMVLHWLTRTELWSHPDHYLWWLSSRWQSSIHSNGISFEFADRRRLRMSHEACRYPEICQRSHKWQDTLVEYLRWNRGHCLQYSIPCHTFLENWCSEGLWRGQWRGFNRDVVHMVNSPNDPNCKKVAPRTTTCQSTDQLWKHRCRYGLWRSSLVPCTNSNRNSRSECRRGWHRRRDGQLW